MWEAADAADAAAVFRDGGGRRGTPPRLRLRLGHGRRWKDPARPRPPRWRTRWSGTVFFLATSW